MSKKKGRRTKVPGIVDLGNGSYRVRARAIDPRTGKMVERDRLIEVASLKEASKEKDALLAEILRENEKERRTLGDYATSWLRGQWNSLCPSTQNRYVNSLDLHILPKLGDRFLDAIRVEDVEAWRDERRKSGQAASTVNGHLQVLRTIFERAVRTGDVERNPAAEAKMVPVDDARITDEEPNALEPEELESFLKVARENHPQHYAMILVLLTTGARMSAVRALRWEDIDAERGVIHVRRRISGKAILPGIKRSRTSKDVVPLHPEVVAALGEHRSKFSDTERESGWMFPTPDGKPRSAQVLKKAFADILKVAGIAKRFTPHGCRRTSTDLYRRVSSEVVTKAITGHLTTRMHEHYSTVTASEKQDAARLAFAAVFKKNGGSAGGCESEVGDFEQKSRWSVSPTGEDSR